MLTIPLLLELFRSSLTANSASLQILEKNARSALYFQSSIVNRRSSINTFPLFRYCGWLIEEQPICVLRGWAAWVLAAIYFRGTCCPTIIDVPMFHFRVRDGTGWGHWAVTTRLRLAVACLACVVQAACPGVMPLWGGLVCVVGAAQRRVSLRVDIREVQSDGGGGLFQGFMCMRSESLVLRCVCQKFTPEGV